MIISVLFHQVYSTFIFFFLSKLVNFWIRILKNSDRRNFYSSKNVFNESDKIDEFIAHFKINNDLTINNFYENIHTPSSFRGGSQLEIGKEISETLKEKDKPWSFDI